MGTVITICFVWLLSCSVLMGAQACGYVEPPPVQEAYEASVSVFECTVIRISNHPNGVGDKVPVKAVTLSVIKSWKRAVPNNYTTLVVYTNRDGAACGYNFEIGASYLVYTHRKRSMDDYLEWVGLNSRTKPLGFPAQREAMELDRLSKQIRG